MNKWEREVFLPKLAKKSMSDAEFIKVSREYDRQTHNVTRQAFNDIHGTVDAIVAAHKLEDHANVRVRVTVSDAYRLTGKWSKKGYLKELSSGPMTERRFNSIMKHVASDNTRKFRKEYNVQRNVANSIWDETVH